MKKILLILFLSVCICSCVREKVDTCRPDSEKEVTIRGTVCDDDGNLMSDVVVSDGFKCVKTDSNGYFEFDSDLERTRFVYVVQPSGYNVRCYQGRAGFYKKLENEKANKQNGIYNLKFTLTKMNGSSDRFTIIMAGDPQPRSKSARYDKFAYHSTDCCNDLWKDMGEFVSSSDEHFVCSIILGDLVHENMKMYADYLDGISQVGCPVYSVIGNHDNDPGAINDDAGARYFEDNLGPRNYAFNIGKFHVVVLDNLIMKKNASNQLRDYDQGLTDEIWEWLKSDLSHVPFSTPLIVCSHSPMFMTASGNDRSQSLSTRHGIDYSLLLSKYEKVYAWAGHVHNSFNYVYGQSTTLSNIEVHTVSRATGSLWLNEWLCEDGTPRGYVLVDVDGKDVSWKFKPVAYQSGMPCGDLPSYKYRDFVYNQDGVAIRNGKPLDESYQVRAYPRGFYGDNYVYANVFMYDEKWGKVRYISDKGGTVEMVKVSDKAKKYDIAYKEVFDFYKRNNKVLDSSPDFIMTDKDGNPLNPVSHLFRCYSNEKSDSGRIVVTDRFGNEFLTEVSW